MVSKKMNANRKIAKKSKPIEKISPYYIRNKFHWCTNIPKTVKLYQEK